MTREEAIKELSEWLDACCGGKEIEPTREAFRMAIEALKAQDAALDTISRQAAIDLFPNDNLESDTKGAYIAPHLARQMICELPSAQSVDKDIYVPIKDCINRQATIDTIMGQPPEPHYPSWYAEQIKGLPPAQLVAQWIPCERELPNDNREVEVTCEVRLCDGKKHRYTCHASYVHRYSIVSTDYCNFEECDEYNEEDDEYYALPGWYERVHNWDDYSFCAIEDSVVAWRELPEPFTGVE